MVLMLCICCVFSYIGFLKLCKYCINKKCVKVVVLIVRKNVFVTVLKLFLLLVLLLEKCLRGGIIVFVFLFVFGYDIILLKSVNIYVSILR